MKNSFVKILVGAGLLLLIPLIAMQFSSGVNWTGSDFAFAFVLLVGLGFGLKMVLEKNATNTSRIGGGVIIVALLWLWVELAVGLVTNWGS